MRLRVQAQPRVKQLGTVTPREMSNFQWRFSAKALQVRTVHSDQQAKAHP